MSPATDTDDDWYDHPARVTGFIAGLGLTSVSLSSGFIWVCGSTCVQRTVIWTPGRRVPLAFLAAFCAWWGYLIAHRAVTGQFIDPGSHEGTAGTDEPDRPSLVPSRGEFTALLARARAGVVQLVPAQRSRQVGMVVGVATLVGGIVVGFVYIRQGNHLLTNVGGALFLGGYVIAHYAETGTPL